ncbi:MAG: aspartate aminotransferase family protein, partial [Nitrososphaerota archaeon]|nr:aspartate aminotransferase family protein [Nitrososphaerota archaeon]
MKADTKKTGAAVVEDGAAITRHYNYGTWKKQEGWKPKLIVGAEGCNFTDSEGNTYLDFSSQLM